MRKNIDFSLEYNKTDYDSSKLNDTNYINAFNNVFNDNLFKKKDFVGKSSYIYLKLHQTKENNIIILPTKKKSKNSKINKNEYKKVNEILIDFVSPICHEQIFSITNNDNDTTIETNYFMNKKRGRKKNGDYSSSDKNKYSLDNQMSKFKTTFIQKFIIDIANLLKDKCIISNEKFFKINKKVIKDLNIKKNINLLNSNVEKLFTYEITEKYKNDRYLNKKLMDKIIKLNKFNKLFFETKIDDLYKIFIKENCCEIIKKKYSIETNKSLKYYLGKISDKRYRKCLEESWKNIYVFFDHNKIKNKESDFK
jgi:hypothetical protein